MNDLATLALFQWQRLDVSVRSRQPVLAFFRSPGRTAVLFHRRTYAEPCSTPRSGPGDVRRLQTATGELTQLALTRATRSI
ncbi:MAG: hypothetical protein WCS94_23645, partial [Verrucomicrobiota bacterium]